MKKLSAAFALAAALSAHAQLAPVDIGDAGIVQSAPAATADSATPRASSPAAKKVGYADAVALGLVEGITEYLPISSTGHLILANAALGLDSPEPLKDASGAEILKPDKTPYTLKDAVDAYSIVIQIGAIAAVAILYWKYILIMLAGLIGRNPAGLRLAVNLLAAFLPAAVAGLALHSAIERYLFGVKPVVIALAAGAFLMFAAQKYYAKREASRAKFSKMEDLKIGQAAVVGILQCVALWPGTSRSMMTILGGYIAGMRPADSAKFSFLLGLITLSAAAVYKTYKDGAAIAASLSLAPLAVGLAVAFVGAALSVKWLVGFLTRKGLAPFAWYRLLLAAAITAALCFDLL